MKLRQTVAAAAIALGTFGVGAANANTYDLTYTYLNTSSVLDNTFSATFNGTGTTADITNISNVHATFNGAPLAQPLNVFSYTAPGSDCPTCWAAGGAKVSSNLNSNNFLFADASSLADINNHNYTNYFYIIPWPNGSDLEATQYFNSAGGVGDGPDVNNTDYVNNYNGTDPNGVLTVTLTAVPEPATWALFLFGFVALGWTLRGSRRKRATSAAA